MHLTQRDLLFLLRIEAGLGVASYVEHAMEGYGGDAGRTALGGLGPEWMGSNSASELEAWKEEKHFNHEAQMHMVRSALFLAVWARFEDTISRYAEDLASSRPSSTVRPNDLRGGRIDQVRAFFEKVLGLQLDLERARWEDLLHLRSLRNHIAHSSLHLGEQARLKALIEGIPGLELDDEQYLAITARFWWHVREVHLAFAQAVIDSGEWQVGAGLADNA